ncbi:replication restart helicase PriA [Limnohabitans planktonicus]|uniref:Replication restart protein PriA n=1 Tax=Limnohabitans planktonicus II-D5 TaxID=1293045 RepID=A0A2T7UDY7_9BURK|nr:primosomal protein N' [Limnohabitans planktonicus]PVE42906.1 primosomal protein N' [Limnohabitans planktonicus II-D5]|eukprot:gene9057-10693_t
MDVSKHYWIDVAVQTPAHSQIGGLLSYRCAFEVQPGHLVRVPLGQRELLGVVWAISDSAPAGMPEKAVRDAAGVLEGLAPLDSAWRQLVQFSAQYYQRSLGEVALSALPPQLRDLSSEQLARRLKKQNTERTVHTQTGPALSEEQQAVLAQMTSAPGPFLLFGSTGSGKTEVYLQAVERMLQADPQAQALLMVPEINLTPQLEERVQARFGAEAVVSMHSGMTPAQRLKGWLAAHAGHARIVLGTRMAIFASMPHLKLIVVDEEHDPSYKQQEGARYSARDLAVYRGKLQNAQVLLASATPSLESWHHSRPAAEGGRYLRLHMPSRIGTGLLPKVRRVDMNHQAKKAVLSAPLVAALQERVERGEQCMLLLNRRGYAPVLHCADCGWKSECKHCSAFRVFHKIDRTLRCHHCGMTERVPRACPACGNADIAPIGRGTEQLEEHLGELLAHVKRPDGTPIRIARIDADTTRLKGALESQLAQVHSGEVDILVGTQMIAKGHDFRRITLVAAINPDTALFSSDFRAPERLFALLMQAAGRAGRDARQSASSEMWVQTFHPTHPLFEALKKHDYPAFAASELAERTAADLPPISHQALLRADARSQDVAQGLLNAARETLEAQLSADPATAELVMQVSLYPAVPMSMQRVADVERAQMLLESPHRMALQKVLWHLHGVLHQLRSAPEHKGVIRWLVDVDPQAI